MVENVTAKQFQAIAALLGTGKVSDAATAAGVAPKTVYAWLKQPDFQAALRAAESDALAGLSRRLAGLGDAAADALADALDARQSIGVRLRAADLLLGRLLALKELVDLEARIAALEAAYRESH